MDIFGKQPNQAFSSSIGVVYERQYSTRNALVSRTQQVGSAVGYPQHLFALLYSL